MVTEFQYKRKEVFTLVAERISSYIKENGLKQSVIAAKAGMTKQALSDSLRGIRRLTVEEYLAICKALGKSANFFAQDD